DALNCLLKDFIRLAQRLRHGCPAVNDLQKLVIGNDNKCIHCLLQILDSGKSIVHSGLRFETERFGNNAYRKDSHLLGSCCDHRRRAGSGTAAHSAGDEYHIRTFHDLFNVFYALLSGLLPNFRLCSRTKALRNLLTDLKYSWSFTQSQSLLISVDTYKLNSSDGLFHHSV